MNIPREALEPLLQDIGDKICLLFEQMERGNWRDDMGHLVRDNKAMADMKLVMASLMIFRQAHLSYDKADPAMMALLLSTMNGEYAGRLYIHPKSGGQYIILGFSYREEDLTVMFHYHPVGQPALVFSRPFHEFNKFGVSHGA